MQTATYETVDAPTRYRLKPMIVEAAQWNGESSIRLGDRLTFAVSLDPLARDQSNARGIIEVDGEREALKRGDYVLLHDDGGIQFCTRALFEEIFEPYKEPENSDFQNRMIERYADKNFPLYWMRSGRPA